jgi:endonuclease/exonuclease/phosphatase family metal-dependent hydrolase
MARLDLLRVVTLNLWGDQGPVARRMPGVLRELEALQPDVVALQEVRQVPGTLPNQAETLAAALDMQWCWALATPWGGGEEGLAILSRHPIAAHAHHELPHAVATERRILLGAQIDTPAGRGAFFTTHLNYRLADGQKREDQIVAAEAIVAATESELPRVWCGDFNATPDADEMRWLRGLRSIGGRRVVYQDAWAITHPDEPGYTWARENPHTASLAFLTRDRRIDYVLVDPERRDGRGVVERAALCFTTPDETGCHPSDHFGVVAEVRVRART